jgi:AcrR family transcriptional regulator
MEIQKKSQKWPSDVPRLPLDRDRIARTALALIDEHGIDQLTMRRLGAELGVEAMALYHYFQNKTSLLDRVLDTLLAQLADALPPDEEEPLPRIRHIFLALRRLSIEHPQAFVSVVQRRFRNQRALVFFEHLLELFHRAGLNVEQSARYYRVLINFTLGGGIVEPGSGNPEDLPKQIDDSKQEKYPRVKATMPYLHESQLDPIFRFGLDLVLAALKNELAGGPPPATCG